MADNAEDSATSKFDACAAIALTCRAVTPTAGARAAGRVNAEASEALGAVINLGDVARHRAVDAAFVLR